MPSELQPGNAPAGVLSGLVQGYLGAQKADVQKQLEQRIDQRDMMIKYLGILANNPDVPAEHRQWALGKIQEGIQHPIDKKPWDVKFSELPPVNLKQPGAVQQRTLPGGVLQTPQRVGQQSGGDVNALGA